MARPTDYCQEIADKICERIALGESLRAISQDDDFPHMATVFRWLNKHQEFSEQYARAREEQAETLADELVSIADNAGNPLMVDDVPLLNDGKPVMYADASAVAHARLKVDARKWVASKLKPKKYGDKLDVDTKHTGTINLHLTTDDAEL